MAQQPSDSLTEALEALAKALTRVIETSRMDDKTPLLNAIALRKHGQDWVGQIDRNGFVVIHGDLNGLKGVNTDFGLKGGDLAIEKAGAELASVTKFSDVLAFREHGDEFWIVAPKEKEAEVVKFLKLAFKSVQVPIEDKVRTISMSFGLARADNNTLLSVLMARADKACKVAKNRGPGELVEWTTEIDAIKPADIRRRCHQCHLNIVLEYHEAQGAVPQIRQCPSCGAVIGDGQIAAV